MGNFPRVAVLMGGPSAEHDVSMNSGAQVLAALEDKSPLAVVIDQNGTWNFDGVACPSLGAALDTLKARAEVAVIALHGPFGEDGTVQALLETVGLPYTGSGVAASALAMDKVRSKYVYQACNLPTAPFAVFSARSLASETSGWGERVASRLGLPAVVKPSTSGSSFGVSFPKDAAALERDVTRLVGEGQVVLVERYVRGRELTCGVLEVAAEGRTFALPPTEIIPDRRFEFFDYAAKYTPGATREVTPAELPPELFSEVQRLAVAAHLALGCRDMSRTDVMIDLSEEGEGRPVLLETNTIPGMTKTSLLPQAAAVAGLSFRQLVETMIDDALRRRPSRR